MHTGSHDTVFALASGAGRTGVSVFRISGSDASNTLQSLTQQPLPRPRAAVVRTLIDPDLSAMGHTVIDKALVIWMPGPNSFTGEDVVELHCHGSPAVRELLADALLKLGIRHADPGEFTRRAFDHGRMDLTEAEGLADLIDADTSAQHKQAMRQMGGALRDTYEGWRGLLIDALAAIEGEIDFPDEMDVPDTLSHAAYAPIHACLTSMRKLLDDARRGERVRHGIDVTIVGPPNAGKSTLLNVLAGRDAAIVSNIAGTTRDIVDVHMVIAGLPVRLSDTAGLRDSTDHIETEGVRRAVARSQESDIRIGVLDAAQPRDTSIDWQTVLQPGDILVLNKIDLLAPNHPSDPDQISDPTSGPKSDQKSASDHASTFTQTGVDVITVSAQSGEGVDAFVAAITAKIAARYSVSEDAGLTRARHRDCVNRAADSLVRAQTMLVRAPELAGDDIRGALHAIRELAGEADIEMVLDQVFSRFCIGK